MQPFLTVNVDTRALDAALAALGRPQLDVAVAKAIADTAKNAMVKAVSLIAKAHRPQERHRATANHRRLCPRR